MKKKATKYKLIEDAQELRLDLGAGKGGLTPDGFTPVDKNAFPGITQVDLTQPWPWADASVDEAHCAMLLQYLSASERVHFFNELYRVLKPGARTQIVTPMWSSQKAYIDVLVQWPPVSEGFYHSLSQAWREEQNEVDTRGFTCDFDVTMGYGMHQDLFARNGEYKQHAIQFWKEAAQDLIVTITKR
jgi:hypothetical protein